MSFLPDKHLIILPSEVDDEFKMVDSDDKHYFVFDKRKGKEVDDEFKMVDSDDKHYFVLKKRKGDRKSFCSQLSAPPPRTCPPLSSHTPEFNAVVNLEIYKKICTSMFDFTSSLCFDKFKDQPLEVCISTNGDNESQNMIVFIHSMPPDRSTLVLKSLSPRWLSSHNTTCTHVGLMGDFWGMNVIPQELIEEIVSHTSPLDACEKVSIVSRDFWSAAKLDNIWERFLPAGLISHQAVSDQWMFYDSCKRINSDTLQAFPTKKIIDDGAMYFWLDKLSWNKCFGILSLPLSTMVIKSLSPRWLLPDNTVHTYVDLMGDVSGMNVLPQELIEDIVSRTSPVDVCGTLSIVSRNFRSAAKSDHVWERFLPSDLISRRAKSNESDSWRFVEDPWKKIDSDTLQAFPTKKDLYLFLSDNPLIIDDGDMYFWLDRLSGNKCFHLEPEKLSIPETDWYCQIYNYTHFKQPFKIEGKISTSLLSPNTAYTAYFLFDFTTSHYFHGFEEEPLQTCVGIDGGCESECETRIVHIPFMPEYQEGTNTQDMPILIPIMPEYQEGTNTPDMPILSGPQYPRRRNDNWYELELGDYFNKEGGGENRELKMCLSEVENRMKGGINLIGIRIRPKNCQKNQS